MSLALVGEEVGAGALGDASGAVGAARKSCRRPEAWGKVAVSSSGAVIFTSRESKELSGAIDGVLCLLYVGSLWDQSNFSMIPSALSSPAEKCFLRKIQERFINSSTPYRFSFDRLWRKLTSEYMRWVSSIYLFSMRLTCCNICTRSSRSEIGHSGGV